MLSYTSSFGSYDRFFPSAPFSVTSSANFGQTDRTTCGGSVVLLLHSVLQLDEVSWYSDRRNGLNQSLSHGISEYRFSFRPSGGSLRLSFRCLGELNAAISPTSLVLLGETSFVAIWIFWVYSVTAPWWFLVLEFGQQVLTP